jgi:hypothetical protein
MNAATPIESRYGNPVVEWDAATLCATLSELRGERKKYGRSYQMPDNGEDSQRLIAEAEHVRDSANHILEADTTTQ